jgi:two-component system, OmpR family, aerobic respiration control sensor histidine kinase ArcB
LKDSYRISEQLMAELALLRQRIGEFEEAEAERIRAEEALQQSERNYRVLFESTLDGMFVIDAQTMRVVLANKNAANIYGFKSAEDAVGVNPLDHIHPDDRERAHRVIVEDLFEKDLRQIHEFRSITEDGRDIWISVVGTRTEYQGKLAALISVRDITERKRSENTLQELYEQERKLRQELEVEMKRRVEFTRALAHELKTPLTPVMASSELLVAELKQEPLLSLAKNINRGASNLNNRIDELLDLARGEIGMLQIKSETVDIAKLLREAAQDMTPVARGKDQSLTLELPDFTLLVKGDGGRLRQVVLNLLNNACKYTPERGKITLRARRDAANLVLEVQDTGRGITKEEQKRLFEPYHRLESDRGHFSGLGLGLALCKKLVELHGGRVWVQSQAGKGSTFGFSLPLETAGVQALKPEIGGKS